MSGAKSLLTLRAAHDVDFVALIAEARVADLETLEHVRRIGERLRTAGEIGSWLMIVDDAIVGLIGYHAPPSPVGYVEIGYNVAPEAQGRGYATAAVALVLDAARADARIIAVLAETDADNVASQIVLERNSFSETERVASDEPSGISIRRRCALR